MFNKQLPIYKDYLFCGFLLSIFLNVFDFPYFYYINIVFSIYFSFSLGFNFYEKKFFLFIRKYSLLTLCFFIWSILPIINFKSYNNSFRNFSFFLLIFSAYCFCLKYKEVFFVSFRRISIFCFISLIYGYFVFLTKMNPLIFLSDKFAQYSSTYERLTSFYLHPIPCSFFYLVGLVLIIYTVRNIVLKTIISLLYIGGIVLTLSRSAWITLFLIIFSLVIQKISVLVYTHRLSIVSIVSFIFCLSLILIGVLLNSSTLSQLMSSILNRIFSINLSDDMSFTWRYNTIFVILSEYFNGNFVNLLFGHGIESGSQLISKMDFGDTFAYNVGAVDNTYISLLYDFGILSIVLLLFFAIRYIKKNMLLKMHFLSKNFIIFFVMGFFFEELYWCNCGFYIFSLIGVSLYCIDYYVPMMIKNRD